MNLYDELKTTQLEEVNKSPVAFAFSEAQFEQGMRKLGLTTEQTDKIMYIGNSGGFCRKENFVEFVKMLDRHASELKEQINADKTGEAFIKDMFVSELVNHEYQGSRDYSSTLHALGIAPIDMTTNELLAKGLKLAIKEITGEEITLL